MIEIESRELADIPVLHAYPVGQKDTPLPCVIFYHGFTSSSLVFDIFHCFGFIQFLVLVDCSYRLADVVREYPEHVGYLKLCHPYRGSRHYNYARFTDCYYSSVHNQRFFDKALFTFIISLKMEESSTRA